jgi:hypothetical protein
MSLQPRVPRRGRLAVFAGVVLVGAVVAAPFAFGVGTQRSVKTKTFNLFPNAAFANCLNGTGKHAAASATVTRGAQNDTLNLTLTGFKPHLGFDMFTIERSNQTASGGPVTGFTNFGLAWYQSDIETNASGRASVTIKTILFDQIFGFDPDAALTPHNTFHVGFWFDSVAEAQPCSGTTLTATPFNGEHTAGPVAFITRPNATTGLGPLCTKPVNNGGTFTCHP